MTPRELVVVALLLMSASLACPGAARAAAGDLDPSFAGGAGFERISLTPGFDDCRAMIVQADGRIVLAGGVQQGTGTQIGLLRLHADGSLDSTFGAGGKRIERRVPAHIQAYAMQSLADGRFVVAGAIADGASTSRFVAARFSVDGVPDSTFGGDGYVVPSVPEFQSVATSLAIQADGKVVLAGWSWNGTDSRFVAARLHTDGTQDASFDGDGIVETDLGTQNDIANAVLVQADGKIVLAGYAAPSGGTSRMTLVRYLSNGALDATFDGDGKLSVPIGATGDGAYAITLQKGSPGKPDRIVVAGLGSHFGPLSNGIALVRLNLDGTFDTSFDGDGRMLTLLPGHNLIPTAVTTQTDRSGTVLITVGGTDVGNGRFLAARYTSAGALDVSFDGDGIATPDIGASVGYGSAMRLVSGGLYVAGRVDVAGDPDFAIARMTSAGALDVTFHGTGSRVENVGARSVYGNAVAVQADGRILVAGTDGVRRRPFELARFLSDGRLDSTFGGVGVADDAGALEDSEPSGVLVQPDTRIVVAGNNSSGAIVARYLATGAPDPAFGTGGVVQYPGYLDLRGANALARQSDGKLIVVGNLIDEFSFPATHYGALRRLDTDGGADGTFGSAGRSLLDSCDVLQAVAVDAQGRIVVAGAYAGQIVVARFTSVGWLDGTFHGGRTRLSIGTGSTVSALLIQPDGKIVLAGTSAGAFGDNTTLARLDSTGTPDATFGAGGVLVADLILGADRACALVRQADGTLLVGAQVSNVVLGEMFFVGHGEFVVAAFRPNGTVESSYGQGGRRVVDLGFATDDVPRAMALDPQGRVVMVGGSEGAIGLCRLLGAGVAGVDDAPPPPAAGFALSAPAPNPAASHTTLRWALPRAGSVRLAIYDVAGRQVRSLALGLRDAGPHADAWDLRDDGGHAVRAGLYFARLEFAGRSLVRRIAIAR